MANAADFVRLALALPDVAEYPHFDRRAFKAPITFATLAPDGASVNLKFSPDEQEFKCLLAPEAFAPIANAWGRKGWTIATLSEDELRAALEMAFAHARTKKRK
jgi:YjbR